MVRHARVGLEDHVREPGDETLDFADLDPLDPGPFAGLVRVGKEELGQQALVADVEELGIGCASRPCAAAATTSRSDSYCCGTRPASSS